MSSNTHPWTTAANDFAAAVAERTEGKVKVDVYPASTLGNGTELLESTQNGTVEMCIVATMQMGAFVPEVQVLDMPYLLPTIADYRAYADCQKRLYDRISDKGELARLAIMNTAESGIFAADRAARAHKPECCRGSSWA